MSDNRYDEAMKLLVSTVPAQGYVCTRMDYAKVIGAALCERDAIIANLLNAIAAAREVGCIDHLDCWDGPNGVDVRWQPAIDAARQHLKERGDDVPR